MPIAQPLSGAPTPGVEVGYEHSRPSLSGDGVDVVLAPWRSARRLVTASLRDVALESGEADHGLPESARFGGASAGDKDCRWTIIGG